MRPTRTALRPVTVAAAFVVAAVATAFAEEPPPGRRLTLVAPMKEGLNVTAINGRGDVVGFHWEPENGDENVLYEAPIFARGGEIIRLPLLKTYTATFPAGVSDDGLVVGRCSKPAPPNAHVHLRNQAFAWTEAAGMTGLGAAEGDSASFATGVSRDGRRISGLSLGNAGLRAVLWERDGDAWKLVVLPDADRIGSNVLAISPDGSRLAAVQNGEPSLWTEAEPGVWRREALSQKPGSLIPRAVNDSGMVVGLRYDLDGTTWAVVWSREDGLQSLTLPEGFRHAQASAVNNAGVVVGQMDGPPGGALGPCAFLYEKGTLRILDEGGPDFLWATAVNDQDQVSGVIERDEDEEGERPDAPEEPAKAP